jgi:hypothetical protein
MYHTTGFTKAQIGEMCDAVEVMARETGKDLWPPILGAYAAMVVTLTYLRRNRVQAELAETYGVSQSTVGRAIAALTPALGKILADFVPVAEELDDHTQYIVDGSLLPCWSWADHRELYSGKHKTTGLNIQVACRLSGRLAWVSDPIDGCHHDTFALKESGVLDTMDEMSWIGDKGYIGNGMLTPYRKPAHRDLLEWEKEYNTQINRVRYVIEQTIAHLKPWRILHTDYRRPLATFKETIGTVIALHFYKTSCE